MYRSSQHRVLNAGCTNKIRSKTGRRLLSALVVTMGLLCVFSQGHAGSLFTSQFASNSEGFTYLDDTFRATNAAYYASGAWISSGGSDAAGGSGGGALRVLLGGINDNVVNGMSGGWRKTFTLDTPSEVLLSFYYKLTQSAEYESDEKSQALVSVDGTLRGQAPNDYIVQIVGDGNGGSPRTTGWQYFEINLGVLSAGEHSIVVGGYNNKKTYRDETTEVLIDDVTVSSDNLAPVLDPLGNKSVSEGQLLQFTVTASDPDGDNLTYSAGSLPEGASFDPLTQTFTWTPGYGQSGTYSGVVFTVTDDGTPVENDSETITITVTNVNRAPVLDPIGNKSVNEGQLLQFTVTATDPDGDGLVYSASNLPPGATFNATTRVFSWTPGYGQSGSYTVVLFTVTDNGTPAQNDSEIITIAVANVNQPPVLDPIGNKSVDEGQLLQFTVSVSDPDGDSLTYSASNLPAGASFNQTTGVFSWTPAFGQAGSYTGILFVVTDSGSPAESDSEAITISVGDVNRAPMLDPIGNKSVSEGQPLQFTVTATDPDGDGLACSASNLPTGATFDTTTRVFSWTPGYGQSGTYSNVLFTVTDNGSPVANDSEAVTISVGNVNRPPVLDPIGNKSVNEGQLLEFSVTATDPDGDGLAYSASNLPTGANFNAATRIFTWTPAFGQSGTYAAVLFAITDNGTPAEGDSEAVTISVGNVNRPPVLDPIGNKSVNEGQLLEFSVTATDPDGDGLAYSASNLPAGANFNAATRIFTWTPAFGQSGTYAAVLFAITDNGTPAEGDSEAVTISVGNVNRPPVLDPIGNKSVNEGQLLEFSVTATDPDGDGLAYSASNLPTGANFNAATRIFTWTPAFGQSGTYAAVLFAITDNGTPAEGDSEAVTISVGNVNRPPVLDPIGNKSVNESQLLEFSVTATDPDGDGLAYSASNLPAGANFNTSTKTFTWTPGYGQAGTYSNVLFTVTDNGSPVENDSEAITITVENINRPPTLDPVGNKTINEGDPLEFTVTATDPDGDGLTYSASNLPSGAGFNPTTRMFTWVPDYWQAGSYSNVLFTVTDNGSPAAGDSEAITITVANVNLSPALEPIGNRTVNEGDTLQFTVAATDPDGNALTYSADNLPSGASFDPTTQVFTWTPGYGQAESYSNVLFTVTDNGTPPASDSESVSITVGDVNRAPILDPIGNKTVNEEELLEFTVSATDPDGDTLTYSVSNLPPGATFNPTTGVFSWTPSYGQAGNYTNVLFTLTDNGTPAGSDSESISIAVGDVNRSPVLEPIGNKTVSEAQQLQFTVTATDPDLDSLTYSASNLPSGASFDAATHVFSWTPNYGAAGNYTNVLFVVTDNGTPLASDSESISITVGDVNRPPVLAPIGNKTVDEGELLEFVVTATDPDGDNLTYSADILPLGASFDPATRMFSWTPDSGQMGNYTDVLFTVTDDGTPPVSDSETITITVGQVNRPPVLDPVGNKALLVTDRLDFTVTGTDPDGDSLTYSASNLPEGASFDPVTQSFHWAPNWDQAQIHHVVFTATDDGLPPISDSESVIITVLELYPRDFQIDKVTLMDLDRGTNTRNFSPGTDISYKVKFSMLLAHPLKQYKVVVTGKVSSLYRPGGTPEWTDKLDNPRVRLSKNISFNETRFVRWESRIPIDATPGHQAKVKFKIELKEYDEVTETWGVVETLYETKRFNIVP